MSFLLQGVPQTSTKQTSNQSTSSTSGSSNTNVTLSPQLQGLADSLLNYGSNLISNPMQSLQPIQNAALQNINQTYASVPNAVMTQMSQRGYGSSGTAGNAMYQANLARAGAVSNLQGQMATEAIQQQQFGANLSQSLLNSLKGSSTTTSANGTSSSSGSETDVTPGQSPLGALANLFGVVTGMGGLGQLFGGGGGSSSGPSYNMNPFGTDSSGSPMGYADLGPIG